MLKLLSFLWSGCFHKWKATSQAIYDSGSGERGPIVYAVCEKCGKRTHFKNATIGDWEK
ncbi:hypothetical protein KZZ07_08250 [Mameliella sp. CS4]|uniref:hypothetical protein n=1 Tax=Mameliella sp. CS4 TaxID=2862329 RepID=UPI001C6029B9|nr:hypothetical protein [Mameliella sp. CS4]MBW4982529.1 hypothetical protein [Mameliella sp. CS4]